MRVAVVLSDIGHWGVLNPEGWQGQLLGGRERNSLTLATRLAMNADVTVYAALSGPPRDSGGITWRQMGQWYDEPVPFDVVFSVEKPDVLRPRRGRLQVLWLQCGDIVGAEAGDGEYIDAWAFLSGWHRWYVRDKEPWLPWERCITIPNMHDGLAPDWGMRREPGRMLWMSSPDRGLHHAFEIARRVGERVPGAALHVLYYRRDYLEPMRWDMFRFGEHVLTALDPPPNVICYGALPHAEAIAHLRRASLLLYPNDSPQPSETFCTVALEACATRTPMMLSDVDCLSSIWGDCSFILPRPRGGRYDGWVDVATKILSDPDMARRHVERQARVADMFSAERVSQRVLGLFETCLNGGVGGDGLQAWDDGW